MNNKLTGEIKMIKWGIIPNLPYWLFQVGQKAGKITDKATIVQILEEPADDGTYYLVICVKKNEKEEDGEPYVWKKYNNKPDEVEYFSPDEKHNYVKV